MEQVPPLRILFVRFDTQYGLRVPVDLLERLSAFHGYVAIRKYGLSVACGSAAAGHVRFIEIDVEGLSD